MTIVIIAIMINNDIISQNANEIVRHFNSDVPIINDNFNIEFDCQKRKFAGNIEFALQLLADYIMNNYINQNIKIEKLLSTNFNKINKDKNI